MLRLANIRNGLAYPHDDVCHFQSQHGHHAAEGYFRIDAMPMRAVIHLLEGGQIVVVDAGVRNRLTDALRFGLPTWCGVFNRAIRYRGADLAPCSWYTDAMHRAAGSTRHRPLVQSIRKLAHLYGWGRPAVIGKTVLVECHGGIDHDDRPDVLAKRIRSTNAP